MTEELSLQEKFAPRSICFGCGPANAKGLRIRSFVKGDEVACRWRPEKFHEAFPGVLNGGIIWALLDCHCNWTACWHLMGRNHLKEAPSTVTAEYKIELKRPTPAGGEVELRAKVIDSLEDRATVRGELIADGKVCATCVGTFVAVKPGHPAYFRW